MKLDHTVVRKSIVKYKNWQLFFLKPKNESKIFQIVTFLITD
jgi:hypothetical protein